MSKRYYGNDVVFGTTKGDIRIKFSAEQRRTHLYVSGVTGSGKSRFLQSLIRQDLDQHCRTRQGLLLLEPHGELYDGALAYIASNQHLWHLPIVLIDLRKDDWIVSYNMLKNRPGLDPAVIATNFVEAFTHAFGGADPTETPRLSRVGRMFIQALFDANRTLFDILPLLAHENGTLREALLRELPPSQARILLEQFNQLSKREFDTWVESLISRVSPMLSNRVISHMLGQGSAPSFDFDRAIEDGAIVLVCLGTERGKIAESDSRLFASLMLSDLWQVAKLRGKRGAGYTKPFAIYADEFQTYLTYSMSQGLDQARGFGLQFVLAQQYPGQTILYGGEHGAAIASSVMVNARTKVVFQAAEQPQEREALVAALFDGAIDVNRLQHNITSFQVVGYNEVRRVLEGGSTADSMTKSIGKEISKGTSKGKTIANGTVTGNGEGETEAIANGRSRSSAHGSAYGQIDTFISGTSTPDVDGLETSIPSSIIQTHAAGNSLVQSDIDSDAESESKSSSTSTNQFRAKNRSTAKQALNTKTVGKTVTRGHSNTRTSSWAEQITLEPILEERPTQLMSIESQVFAFGQQLAAQPTQHAYVRLPGERLPESFRALDCPEAEVSPQFIERIRTRILVRTNCALMFSDASARIRESTALLIPDTDTALRTAAAGRRRGRGGTVKEHGDE